MVQKMAGVGFFPLVEFFLVCVVVLLDYEKALLPEFFPAVFGVAWCPLSQSPRFFPADFVEVA